MENRVGSILENDLRKSLWSTVSNALLCQGQRMTVGLNNKDVSNNFDRNSFGRTVDLRLDLEWV